MKLPFKLPAFFLLFFISCAIISGQETKLTEEYQEKTIHKLSQLMNDFYVFPEVAKLTESHLLKQLNNGYYQSFADNKSFADELTKSVQEINKDKHMRIMVNRPYEAPDNSPERLIEERLDRIERSRKGNYGFNTVQILEGNVGYIDLRGFAGLENAKPNADAAMKLMARTDAIIFDLRKNGGGSPRMVQYLCSFFFDHKVHLNSLYWREGNITNEFWTLDEIGGKKMPDVPLFVITSANTFSAAEEFSYNMQTQKRALIVGQTSGGGANPGGTMGINEYLRVFIPTGKAINPITNTNWEGIGVIPKIKTTIEGTFEKTHNLAKEAAQVFRNKTKENFTGLFMALNNEFEHYVEGKSDKGILEELTKCRDQNLLREQDINSLGYSYLLEHKKPKVAASIFKANTILFSNSPNTFDSYAESLMMNGDLNASIKNYQIAVKIAAKIEDPNLELYKNNLNAAQSKLEIKN